MRRLTRGMAPGEVAAAVVILGIDVDPGVAPPPQRMSRRVMRPNRIFRPPEQPSASEMERQFVAV